MLDLKEGVVAVEALHISIKLKKDPYTFKNKAMNGVKVLIEIKKYFNTQ